MPVPERQLELSPLQLARARNRAHADDTHTAATMAAITAPCLAIVAPRELARRLQLQLQLPAVQKATGGAGQHAPAGPTEGSGHAHAVREA